MTAEPDLVKTGIAGLDAILSNGIPRGNVILVEGAIGAGKTTLGVECVYRGASLFDEPGVIVLFEISPHKLVRDAARFGWDLPALERQHKLKIVFTTRQVFWQEVRKAEPVPGGGRKDPTRAESSSTVWPALSAASTGWNLATPFTSWSRAYSART